MPASMDDGVSPVRLSKAGSASRALSRGAGSGGSSSSRRGQGAGMGRSSSCSSYDDGDRSLAERWHRWLHQADRWCFPDIPENFPLRAKVKIKVQASNAGWIWDVFQTLASVLSCLLYVLGTYGIKTPMTVEWALTFIFTVELLIRYYVADDRFLHTFKFYTLIDWLTVLPMYIEYMVRRTTSDLSTSYSFFRFARLTRVLRVMRTLRFANQRNISKTTRQYFILALTVLSLVFVSAGLVQMVEPNIDFGTAIYFMVVTMSTVGYGDVHPETAEGQLVVSIIIITAWILVPLEISRLFQVLATRSKYRTSVARGSKRRHVLLVGDVTNVLKIQKFVSEFYHPDRPADDRRVRIVVVGPDEPARELRELMLNPILEGRVSYIKASVMREHDLERLAADEAKAAFVLSDWLSGPTEVEDSRAIVRTLMLNNFSPRLPCYVQLGEPANSFQLSLSPSNRVLCADSIKMAILGLSVANPGVSTLVTNMMTSSKASLDHVRRNDALPWLPQYLEGTNYELYIAKLPPAVRGMDFHEAVLFIYAQTGGRVILLGIREPASDNAAGPSPTKLQTILPPSQPRIHCNPGSHYFIPAPSSNEADAAGATTSAIPLSLTASLLTVGVSDGVRPRSGSGGSREQQWVLQQQQQEAAANNYLAGVFLSSDAEEVERVHALKRKEDPAARASLTLSQPPTAAAGARQASGSISSLFSHPSLRARLQQEQQQQQSPSQASASGSAADLDATVVMMQDDRPPAPAVNMQNTSSSRSDSRRVLPVCPCSEDEQQAEPESSPAVPASLPPPPQQQEDEEERQGSVTAADGRIVAVALTREGSSCSSSMEEYVEGSSSSSSSYVLGSLPDTPRDTTRHTEEGEMQSSSSIALPLSRQPSTSIPEAGSPVPTQEADVTAERASKPSEPRLLPPPLLPQRRRSHAQLHHIPSFSLGGHQSMEDFLQSLSSEGECLRIDRRGVERRPVKEVRQLEGHVLVICQLASLACLAYFIAPLRHDADAAVQEAAPATVGSTAGSDGAVGPPVVVMVSRANEPGSSGGDDGSGGGGVAPSRRKGLRKVVEGLRRFGPIYLVEGDASTEEGLTRAGMERARACVMLADKTSTKLVDGHFVDNASLRRYLSIQKFLFDADRPVRQDFVYLAEVQSSTTLRIMDRYQEKIRTAPRELLLHSLRELSYHGGTGGTVKRVSNTVKALGTGAVRTLKRSASFRGGDELESRFEASRAVSFGIKDAYTVPFFAAGKGFLTHIFDTLPCQAYFIPDAVRFFELLVGHSLDFDNPDLLQTDARGGDLAGAGGNNSALDLPSVVAAAQAAAQTSAGAGTASGPDLQHKDSNNASLSDGPPAFNGHLRRIPVPMPFLSDAEERQKALAPEDTALLLSQSAAATATTPTAVAATPTTPTGGRARRGSQDPHALAASIVAAALAEVAEPTFGTFVRYMVRTRGLIPIGLYRHCAATNQHYVVTAPDAGLLLGPSDQAFVVTPGGPLSPLQQATVEEDARQRRQEAEAERRRRDRRAARPGGARGQGQGQGEHGAAARLQGLFLNIPQHAV